MPSRVFLVTGGLRGLGQAMTFGLAQNGFCVFAVGHLPEDADALRAEISAQPWGVNIATHIADVRDGVACDVAIEAAITRFGRIDGLVNNAGLTFTYINPNAEFGKTAPRFWEIGDQIVQDVMDTNFVSACIMAKRIAPKLIEQGWGRILNVTTRLSTMNSVGTTPYGSSKSALETASEVWAKEIAGTGVTVNILNPGAGAHTPGMADTFRQASREGKMSRFIEPEEMVPPLLWLVSSAADAINGMRYDAFDWDTSLDPATTAKAIGRPAGFELKPQSSVS